MQSISDPHCASQARQPGRVEEGAPLDASAVGVLLVGNYSVDRQESMQRFANLLASEFRRLGIDAEMIAPRPFFGRLKPSAHGVGKWLGYIDKFVLFPFTLRRSVASFRRKHGKHPVVHLCDHSSSHYTRYLGDVPNVVTCHDLLAVRMARNEFGPGRVGFTGRQYQRLIERGLRRARKIVCVSNATKEDIVRILDSDADRLRVVFNGLNYPYSPLPLAIARQRVSGLLSASFPQRDREFTSPYILHVGGNHWYKNRPGVIHIYAALHRQCRLRGIDCPKLILSGSPVDTRMLQAVEDYAEWKDDIVVAGSVTSEDLCALYSAAELLLFPSYEEGFGWPIIEAQACGCRVVTTGKAPMTEVGSDAAVYLQPEDVGSLSASGNPERAAATVLDVLHEPSPERVARITRGLTNARRFSTSRMVEEYLRVYREFTSPALLQVHPSGGRTAATLE